MSLDKAALRDSVIKARETCKEYVDGLLSKYSENRATRFKRSIPVIAFCGHGRAGKDLGAEWLGQTYDVKYGGSLSEVVCPLVAVALDKPQDVCFEERHTDRNYWYEFCNALREQDPTLLARMLLSKADIVVGVRGAIELEACKSERVIDLTLWVDNYRVQTDPTVEYTESDCDLTISNHDNKLAYFSKLRRLAELLNLPIRR